MEYKIMHIPISKGKREGNKIAPTGIVIHSTANPSSTAINERNWLVNPSNNRVASWHIAVDEKMAVEAIPLNEKAIHASSSVGNNTTIGIEMCESGDREKVLKNTVELVAKMLFDRNWEVSVLRRHFDFNKKPCPRILMYNNWEGWTKFKNDVQIELDRLRSNKVEEMINVALEKWKEDMGKVALDSLSKKKDNFGQPIVNAPQDWKKTLGDDVPQWLFWSIIDRISK